MADQYSLDYARQRDAADPLASFRNEFSQPRNESGAALLYLCGHSLGLMPFAARDIVMEELDDWARLGVRGHEAARRAWVQYPDNLRYDLASIVGCHPDAVVAMNSLTINLHLMLASFYRPEQQRRRIIIEAGAFSSDRHAITSQLEWHGLDPSTHLIEVAPLPGEDLIAEGAVEQVLAEHGDEVALVLWPGVQFRTGQSFDLPRIADAARRAGAVVGFDLAHMVGNVPVSLQDTGADFAVWCSYKYLNAGPGAIGGCYVNPRHFGAPARPRLSGWWGQDIATRFEMGPRFDAAYGASGFQVSNQPILSAAPLAASLAIFRAAGLDRLRQKSIALTQYLEQLIDRCAADVTVVTPRDPAARGAQISMRIGGGQGRGKKLFDWLSEHGVVCDWRAPDIVRVAPVPLYNTFEDVFRFGEWLERALLATR